MTNQQPTRCAKDTPRTSRAASVVFSDRTISLWILLWRQRYSCCWPWEHLSADLDHSVEFHEFPRQTGQTTMSRGWLQELSAYPDLIPTIWATMQANSAFPDLTIVLQGLDRLHAGLSDHKKFKGN